MKSCRHPKSSSWSLEAVVTANGFPYRALLIGKIEADNYIHVHVPVIACKLYYTKSGPWLHLNKFNDSKPNNFNSLVVLGPHKNSKETNCRTIDLKQDVWETTWLSYHPIRYDTIRWLKLRLFCLAPPPPAISGTYSSPAPHYPCYIQK